ncbi:HNH endonuclease, partial [Peribacillus frigoritolerans]|uniref:HNH endonuclease n=1 Tax=Peribacillus frigoritolerans TaxID=450367 RepID=UPI002417E718
KSVNNLEEHNRWINFIHSWINDYSININKFCVWVVNDNPEPITLNQFIYDSIEVERKIYQQQQNSTFSFRVGVILTRNEFLGLDNYESILIEFLNQLKGIYQYTSLNAINDELAVAINKDIEVELSEENNIRLEGTVKHYFGKRYERDPINRKRAIEIHGLSCMGCGFNFEEVYGERGKDFIEVHHVKPVSTLKEKGVIDPEHDLIPVCSNCHRIIHRRRDNMLTVEKLKELVTDHFRGKM